MKINIGKYPKKSSRRKINVKIDSYDTWSLDHTLATIIYPALLQLKATKHGLPSEFVDDVGGANWEEQDSFDFYKETHDESWQKGAERWDEVLDKMIWAFEQLVKEDYNSKYHHGEAKYDWVKSDKQIHNPITGKVEETYQMVDKNPEEHWFDSEGLMLHEKRMQEGFELFGKYFRNLWD
jgi:hypothetical protein